MMILIYMALIALCMGIVWFMGRLSSPVEPGGESVGIETPVLPEETEGTKGSTEENQEMGGEDNAEKTEENTEDNTEDNTEGNIGESAEESLTESKRASAASSKAAKSKDYGAGAEEALKPEVYEPPTIVTISDIHYFSPDMTDYGEAFDEMVEKDDGKLVSYIPQMMDLFAEEMKEVKPDALILSGDLTLNGERAGHEALAEKLRSFTEQGIRVLVIPGNHDINNRNAASYFGDEKEAAETIDRSDFADIYHEFGYDQAISRDEDSLSYIFELDEKNWLMMLDSAQYDPVNLVGGRIRSSTVAWMEEQLEAAKELGIAVIPIAHHNLLKESILYPDDCTMENSDEVTELLERYEVPVFLSGHLHLQRTKKYKPEPGEPDDVYHISEIVADSFAIAPFQYGILSWDGEGGLRYRTKEADMEGLGERIGLEDGDLMNFREFGTDFLVEVISRQMYGKMTGLPEEHKRMMAELYGELNRAYCAGIPIDTEEVKTSEAFRLWERNLPDSRMFEEMDDILRDTKKDHNTWEYRP